MERNAVQPKIERYNQLVDDFEQYKFGKLSWTIQKYEEVIDEIERLDKEIDDILQKQRLVDLVGDKQVDFVLTLIRKIKETRVEKGFSIREIADICNVSPTTYQKVEQGKQNVNIFVLMKILQKLDLTLEVKNVEP